ncbi:vitamin B12-dependent ribonucleotide reductase, partial [mine drainage metagenome]
EHDTIEGAPHLRDDDLAVFDCAFPPANGQRSITWQGHIRMMAAVQPFISGAISKTVNLPKDASPEDVELAYTDAWKLGLKAVAVYRDGSKRSQPLSTSHKQATYTGQEIVAPEVRPARHRLPSERAAITHKFEIQGHEGYLTVGLYEDGQPGEIFLTMAKEGSTLSGMMDSFATAVSVAPVWRASPALLRQIRAQQVRTSRLHREPRDPHRQVHRRLHLPLAGSAVPVRGGPGRPGNHQPPRGDHQRDRC